MKKFLFTLAALMMVGTSFAETGNYWYIEDFEVTPEFLAQTSGKLREVTVDVKAHFDQYVSAFQIWINSPEGITNRDALAGEAMTQDGYTRTGTPITRSVALSVNEDVNIFIAAWTENDWYYPEGLDPDEDDPVAVGSVKWAPGDYNQMFTLTVRFAQTFEGGDIMVISEPACAGSDPRGECCPKDEHHEIACHVTVAGAVTPEPAPVPTVTMSDTYEVSAVCADHEVVLMINGEPVANPYQITQTYDPQTITFTAYTVANADESENSQEVTFVAEVPAMPQPTATTPIIDFVEDANGLTITIDNYTVYNITVDGVQVDPTRAHEYYVEKVYDKAQAVVVYAKNDPGTPYLPAEDTKSYNLPAKEKAQNSTPTVTYTYENGELTVTASGCTEENVTYTLYCDGVEYTGTFPIAVVAEDGYNHTWTATAVSPTTTVSEVSDPCEIVIDPVTPTPTTPDPTINVAYDDENEKVIITVEGEGTVTATVTYADGPVTYNDEDGDGKIVIEIPYGDAVSFVNVVATAQNPGENPGGANEPLVEIPAATPVTPTQTAPPTIEVVPNADGSVTVNVTGNGTLNVLIEGYDLELDVITYNGPSPYSVTLQQADEAQEITVSATAQATGELVSDPAVKTFEIEAKTPVYPETCVAANGDYVIIDKEKALVTITNNEEGATVHYVVTLNGVTVAEGDFTGDTWEYVADGVGDWVVTCVASLPGKNDSQPGGVFFPIAENQWPTAVDEMMAGKTISNVRYFNVAGQEMQEANGTTIVVTTYTDGTKSAVKVMK